jgi:tetratricopeptide (TPR) repeat protein
MNSTKPYLFPLFYAILLIACAGHTTPSAKMLDALQLKRGQIIACGPPEKEFGTVNFRITGNKQVQEDFNTAVALLHSFEYDDAEKAFAKIIDESPSCAMAYWGVAMCNFHPLWEPPSDANLKKGSKAIEIANSIKQRSPKESAFIEAIALYYKNWSTTDPHSRTVRFENAMQQLYRSYPDDREAAIFYALALDAAADPTDKTYANQLRAGKILDSMWARAPNHPGIVHYIIHTYDYPGIAQLGLNAARRYADVAPSSAHALHMPSHIFTRLGLWDESIRMNTRSMDAAQCYAQAAGLKGHSDEELHALDYLVYAYLQKGDDSAAEKQLAYLATIEETSPSNFKVSYTFAAVPVRVAIENKDWKAASLLTPQPATLPWSNFPWQEAIVHFGKLLGLAHTGDIKAAQNELVTLDTLHAQLVRQNDIYKARQVEIQMKAGKAWIAHANKNEKQALQLMESASNQEDSVSKSPVTPGEVLPARELYADMLFDLHQYKAALAQYELALKKSPNRFNSLFGAGRSAELLANSATAAKYYKQLIAIADPASNRPELKIANMLKP